MPRLMAVVLGVGVLVWALAFVDFGRPRARRGAAAVDEPSAAAEAPRLDARASTVAPKPAAGPPPAAQAPSEPTPPPPTPGALSTATGEVGHGTSSLEFAEMERTYAREPRDGLWAEGEERRLHDLLARSPLAAEVALVNCQETLCRVLLESDDFGLYARLLAVPGWTELTGIGPGSPYSHRSGQLSVYFPRRGSGPATR